MSKRNSQSTSRVFSAAAPDASYASYPDSYADPAEPSPNPFSDARYSPTYPETASDGYSESNPLFPRSQRSSGRFRARARLSHSDTRQSLQDFAYPSAEPPVSSAPGKRASNGLGFAENDLLGDALQSDPHYLRDQLEEVLGFSSKGQIWMADPAAAPASPQSDEFDFRARPHSPPDPFSAPGSSSADPDLTYNIPMITLNDSARATNPYDPDLEAGTFVAPPSTAKPVSSPAKILGLLSRISDRVAGSNNPATPVVDTHPDSFASPSMSEAPGSPHSASSERWGQDRSSSPSVRSHSSSDSINSVPLDDPDSPRKGARLDRVSTVQVSPSLGRSRSNLASVPSNPFSDSSAGLGVPTAVNSAGTAGNSADERQQLFGRSLGLFGPDSRLRQWCHSTVSKRSTNAMVLAMILAQTAVLALRQWSANSADLDTSMTFADLFLMVINAFYTLEICVKVLAYGLYDDTALFEATGIEYPTSSLWYACSSFYSTTKAYLQAFSRQKKVAPAPVPQSNSPTYPNSPFSPYPSFSPEDSAKGYSDPSRHAASRHGSITSVVNEDPKKRLYEQNSFLKTYKVLKTVEEMNLKRAFLRSSWQRLDFVSVACFWISMLLNINHWDHRHHFMLFRALGCIRIWRLLNLTTGTNIILRACQSAIPQLIDVGIFVLCFWVIFSIIGVQSFKSSLSRHCVWTNPDDPSETYTNSDSFCGSYIGKDGNVLPYLDRQGKATGYAKGWRCPVNSVCQSGENPYGGTVNFDNILQAMQVVFVMISVNTFSDTMYNVMNTDSVAASLFFVVGIYVLTVWLMNIFIAIIVASFDFVQMEEKEERKRKEAASQNDKSLESRKAKLKSWFFNDEIHSKRISNLISRKPWLKQYYRFEFLFLAIIMCSVVTQSFRSHNMKQGRASFLYRMEAVFTGILLLEIVLRFLLFLPDWRSFFLSHRNVVDLCLAAITSVIILGPVKERLGHAYYWLTFFQLARFYRVVLAFRITSELWIKITKNFKAIYDLTLFYFILLVLTSIIVARYFEGSVPADQVDEVQFAMHTLPNTIMTLYVITSTENWADIMYTLQEYAANVAQRSFGSIILIIWFVISNYMIMNIFIAVIAKSLEVSLEGRRKHQLHQFIDDMTKRLSMVKDPPGWLFRLKAKWFKSREEKNIEKAVTNLLLSGSAVTEFLNGEDEKEELSMDSTAGPDDSQKSFLARMVLRAKKLASHYFENPFYVKTKVKTDVSNFEPSQFATEVLAERRSLIKNQDDYLKQNPSFNTVFYMLEPDHKLRRLCQRIVPSSFGERIDGVDPHKTIGDIFSIVMFASTVGIVIAACYLTPIYRLETQQRDGRWNWSFFIDVSFQAIFTLELLIKVTADGLIFTPNAYARSPWNWLDFGALSSLWIEFAAYIINDGDLSRIVRGMKALRALRLLTISETAKNNFHYTMLSGFGKILSATVISLTLLFPFSVWALNVFNGRLGYCLDGESSLSQCINEFESSPFDWNVLSPNVYTNPILHMDSFGSSFSTFYQIVSLEGWTDLLINVMQSTGVGTPQKMFSSPANGIFIMFFNFVSTIFILTLFVSVIINNYAKVTGRAYLTDVQIQWYHVKKFLKEVKPSKRREVRDLRRFKRFCYRLTVERNSVWHSVLGVVLALHLFALVFETFPSRVPVAVQYAFFFISTFCFLAHYSMMIVAQGWKVFVSNKWNVFSFVVTLGAWVSTCTGSQLRADNMFVNFNKMFLVGLLIFLFPRSDRLNQLLKFASASFPSLFSLLFTWLIIYIAYAIAMNQVFGLTKIGPNTSNNINLRSVPKALILLFRCSFGEGWNYIMSDFTLEEPFCSVDYATAVSDCGNKQYAYFFFMSWNLISMYIMLNLFVSLILDSFSYIAGGTEYHHLIARPEIRKFKRAWQKYDPQGSGFIGVEHLAPLVHSLRGSLSFQFYHGSLTIPQLTEKWISRHGMDPYNIRVDCGAINRILQEMDLPKIQQRRRMLERFMEEVKVNMELHEEPGISFTRLLTQLPLYTAFDPGQCLVLIDFLENRLLHNKIDQRLQKQRCMELIRGYACRWRYKQWKRQEISTEQFLDATDINEGRA